MSKTDIAAVVVGIVTGVALPLASFSAGHRAGREQSHLDRLDAKVQTLSEASADVQKRLDELEHWRGRFGKQPGAAPQ